MRRVRMTLAVVAVGSVAALGAGCGGGGSDTGATPSSTPTAQTTIPADTGSSTAAAGDAAAGKTFFEGTCQGCHTAGGTEAGAGPKLAGMGLTADAIKKQIQTPRGAMPPNLASGADLDNVIAYVESIQ